LASAHVTDYSQARYIPVIDGEILVWEEFAYVTHTANLSEYGRVIEETTNMIDMFPLSHMKKLLSVDTAHLQDLLESLGVHHRVARSLDFLGSMLKVVAGTPDASDLEKIKFTEMRLVESSNRQIQINTKTQNQINQLTSTVNSILRSAKISQIDTGHLYETLLARNRMLMAELQNLMLAITLARINIVSPNILDHEDLETVWLEEPTDTPIGDLLSVSSVKILQSRNILHFIIKFPKIKLACKKITIFPVAHGGTMLQIIDNVIAECSGEVYAIKNCSESPRATFCRLASESSCAKELHAGGVAHCRVQESDLHPITYVDEGIIIINDRSAKVRVDNGTEIWTHGTHLITFDKQAIINDTLFINHNNTQKRAPGIASLPLLNITATQDVLSLPYLHRLSARNLEFIKEFKEEIENQRTRLVAIIAGAICCALICIGLIFRRFTEARKSAGQVRQIIAELQTAEGGLNSEGGVVN